ncbi:65-kDa microtubule-associated protein 8 isoform X1 [Aristolochia californica]|uniref:65-kDa microtubule-associated protein 8 isoform X1 n=1 Tax=Aristolochia californica TaxID=171875 RepID=UPI0035DFCB60
MGSFEMPPKMPSLTLLETSCGYLLQELKLIWDEIGQDQFEREKYLLELEQECLDVYRRKVDSANISRARLHQTLADSEAEYTHLLVSLGERSFPCRPEKMAGTLKEQLDSITPALREMQLRKEERVNQFLEVQTQIQKISAEIEGNSDALLMDVTVNENDLSLKKLDEYRSELQRLHREKNKRLQKVEDYLRTIHSLSATMGMDPSKIIVDVHPSLDVSCKQKSKNISDVILSRLDDTVESLKEEKQKRLEKLHKLGKALTNLWCLMDTSSEERRSFSHITDFTSISASEISKPGSLAPDIIHEAEAEVQRLDQLKASKMKELFLKKKAQLEEICKKSHMEIPTQSEMDNIINLINSGDTTCFGHALAIVSSQIHSLDNTSNLFARGAGEIDHEDLLASMDEQISKAREEASSRKDIMEKVEKWMVSCDEERWLEEYMRDENRYSVSRGAHKNLKRAERARVTVSRIPALVDSLTAKTKSWEEERKKVFLYDEVPLLAMLEEYNLLRQEKEEERKKQREKKKMQGQMVIEQENLFGTSYHRLSNISLNMSISSVAPLARRLSVGTRQYGPNRINTFQGSSQEGKRAQGQRGRLREDKASHISATCSNPSSPQFLH